MLPANHSLLPPNDGLLPPNDKTLRMRNSQMPTMKKKSGCLHLKNKECTVFHRFAESLSTHKFIEIQGKASPKQGGIGAQGAQLSYNGDRLDHTLKPAVRAAQSAGRKRTSTQAAFTVEVCNGGARLIGNRLMLLHLRRGLGVISPEFVTSKLRLSTLYPKISFSFFTILQNPLF